MSILTSALKVLVGRENVAFGTTAAVMVPLTVEVPQLPMGEGGREMLANNGSSAFQHDNRAMIRGLERRQPVKVSMLARHSPAQLNAAATPPVAPSAGAGALSQDIVLEHWLGGFNTGAGGVVTTGADENTVPLATSGHGARFDVGQPAIFHVAGAPYVRIVSGIATDTLSTFPDLPGIPASGQVVLNTTCFFRKELHTQTMTMEALHSESGTPEAQQRGRGVRGQCAWTAEVGGTAALAFDGMLQARDDGNLSLSITGTAEDMGPEVVWSGESYLFASGATASPAHTCISKIAVTVPNTWQEIMCVAGVEGASGVVMTGGRSAPATVEITTEFDADYLTAFDAGTTYALLAYAVHGTGDARRVTGWWFPRLAFDAEPTRVDEGGLVKSVLKFRALANANIAGDPLGASSTDLSRSPVVLFRG